MNQQYADALLYWIEERERIRVKKEAGEPKPWSDDPVFKTTYFCNVHREDDKVTKWIRKFYSPFVYDPMFEYNIVLSRFVNKPSSLEEIGYLLDHNPDRIEDIMSRPGTWGNAYVITTHGIPMSKARYLAQNVLGGAYRSLQALRSYGALPTCRAMHERLQGLEGLGSFLAAQVVADLKNTEWHPLYTAEDWWTFVAPGPGSIRGLSWFTHGRPDMMTTTGFQGGFQIVRDFIDKNCPVKMCNQDLQNCLCEFDKYCRVRTGTGRSKRGYNG
jgi:hypothetical protein